MAQPHLKYPLVLSLLAAVATLALKWLSYFLTGSVGLLSEAAEAGVNLLAALTALASLWYSAQPVDSTHTYGHEKIEYFSSGLEGVLILVAAAGIAWYAIHRLLTPEQLNALNVGTILTLVAAGINFAVARLLLRVSRTHASIVLEAGGRHLMTDVWTTLAVVAGLGLVRLTGKVWIDALMGLVVSANVVWTGFVLLRRSFNGLMDHALPEEEQAAVRAAIEAHLERGMDYHALRTRQAGSRRFADFHLLVPGTFSVRRAHELTKGIEEAVRAALPGVEVTIHIEPIEDRAAWEDSELVRLEQAARRAQGAGESTPSEPPRQQLTRDNEG